MRARSLVSLVALVMVACGSDPGPVDAGHDGGNTDGGNTDAGSQDAAELDAPELDAPGPDAPGRDATGGCGAVADARGWELCASDGERCEVRFGDGAGCPAVCAALGLPCAESYEDQDAACAPDTARPPLGCAETGHVSDYCVCGGALVDAGPADAGTDAATDAGPPRPTWEALLDEREGFGAAATGGAGGERCVVTSLAARGAGSLRECLAAPAPRWITFDVSGTIELGSVDVPSDTTIDGRGQRVVLRGGSSHLLDVGRSSNVILSHLVLEDAEFDLVHTDRESVDVWLHHLSLERAGDELLGLDGARATVSWCHLQRNNYAILIGGSFASETLFVTLHHNHFEGNSERHPRTRGRVHSYNNLVEFTLSGGRVSDGAHLLSEGNVYAGDGVALISRPGGSITVGGHYRSVGDRLEGGARADGTNDPDPVFAARDHYDYTVETADDGLAARVRAGAGWQDVPAP